MTNKIIFKIIDEVQYKLSHAYKDTNLKNILQTSCKKRFFTGEYSKVFSAVDGLETDSILDSNNFYIFPVFYNHSENLESLDAWREHVKQFVIQNNTLLKQQNVVLALCDPYETSQHFITSVEYIADDVDFDVLAITANKRFKSMLSNVKVIYNDTWLEKFPPRNEILNFSPKRLYINLNRVARHHRCMLMDSLIDNDLLKYGYNTWGNTYEVFASYKSFINPNTKIDQQVFDVLDIQDLDSINPNYFVPEKYCSQSFLFLNTETNIESDQLFFSEKVYKPLGIGMPFITLGNPRTLQDLRDRGFVTFGDWFDERYDNDYPIQERIQIIIENIKKYSKYTRKDLKKIRSEMNEVCNHNLRLYTAIHKKNWLKENIELYVRDRQ